MYQPQFSSFSASLLVRQFHFAIVSASVGCVSASLGVQRLGAQQPGAQRPGAQQPGEQQPGVELPKAQ